MTKPTESKSELLNQLKLDKSVPPPASISPTWLVAVALLAALTSALITAWWLQPAEIPAQRPADIAGAPAVAESIAERSAAARAKPADPAAVETASSTSKTVLNASGYITARRIATVSAEVLGLITSVEVEEGMRVATNQVIARLDDAVAKVNLELAQARVAVLQASLQSVRAELDEAQRVFERVRSLQGSHFSSEAELTSARATRDKLQSSFAAMRADISVARLEVARQQAHFDKHTIRAPFAGVVTVKNAQPGEIVSPSSAGGGFTRTGICTIVDMDSLEIEVDVNEAFIGRVLPEQHVIANLDAYPDWDIPASVIAIIPTADRAKATVRVRVKIDATDTRILPDMGVKVAFLKQQQD